MTWEKDLECSFTDDEWETTCEEAQTFSINSRDKLMQFNVIHTVEFITPQLCPRCKADRGALLNMLWSCPDLEVCWKEVLEIIAIVAGTNVPREPRLALLGDTTILHQQRVNLRFVRLALLAAITCITLRWKDSKPPSTSMWSKEVSSYIPLEKIAFCL